MQPSTASLTVVQGVPPSSGRSRCALLVAGLLALLALALAGAAIGSLHRVARGFQQQAAAPVASLRHLAAMLELSTPPSALQGVPARHDPRAAARELAEAIQALPGHLADYRASMPGADTRGLERALERWSQAARALQGELAGDRADLRAISRAALRLRVARQALAEAAEQRRRIDVMLGQSSGMGLGARVEETATLAGGALLVLACATLGLLFCGLRLASAGRRNEEAVREAGRRDALTQLPNRRALEADLELLVEGQRRGLLVLVKLERFTRVVHVYGPVFADRTLVAAARRIIADLTALHGSDVRMYRLEGTMFALMLPEVSRSRAMTLMHAVVKGFNAPLRLDEHDIFLDLRVGLVEYPEDSSSVDVLVSSAETALRFARDDGAVPVRLFDPDMRASLQRRTDLEEGLQRACADDSLTLHYHPQIEVATGRLVGVEALLRWRHPRLGMVSPAEFIPIAEEMGAINDIGRWVLRRACEQLAIWQRMGHPDLRMSVNVSPLQLATGDLPDLVADVLRATGIAPAYLELEITEGFSLNDMDLMSSGLHALKSVGVRLAVDDFGTGYSSLSYLRQLPVDVLKIDRSFIRELQRDAKRYDLVRIVIDLGHALGHEVIAEGIEMADELRALQWLGCDLAQGYLTCRPLSAEGLTPLLGRTTWLPEGILPTAVLRRRTRLGHRARAHGRLHDVAAGWADDARGEAPAATGQGAGTADPPTEG